MDGLDLAGRAYLVVARNGLRPARSLTALHGSLQLHASATTRKTPTTTAWKQSASVPNSVQGVQWITMSAMDYNDLPSRPPWSLLSRDAITMLKGHVADCVAK
jgi:hypothetical protein